MEWLDRGLVAMESPAGIFLSWRVLGTDGDETGFNLYRNGKKITDLALSGPSNFLDQEGKVNDRYAVEAVQKNDILGRSQEVKVWPMKEPRKDARKKGITALPYLEIPLSPPSSEHRPGDMSVGDLDGDGEYELVFEWEGQQPYLEAIKLDGRRLWRIDCGPNVTRNKLAFLVYDFDGDGKAEVACKTGPRTRDGTGRFLSKGPAGEDNDREVLKRISGRLVEDPAYISVFKGETGAELASTLYWPPIGPESELEATWDDNYGHRASSIKAAVLYQNGSRPLLVFARGIYSRIAMQSYRWDGIRLEPVWTFDTEDPEHPEYRKYRGQGNHSLAVGDVDGDGSDELIYGACAIDHEGTGLYSTGMGHGDSHALGDLDPSHPGLEFYQGHENKTYGISMRAAGTGEILWESRSASDVGRAWAADVDARFPGAECTSIARPNTDCKGNVIETNYNSYSQPVYFDGDVQRELRNGTIISLGPSGRILEGWRYGAGTIHSSKKDANLVADILGDWREEIVFRRGDNQALLVFSSWLPTDRRNYTLMHDSTYRMNVVVQNIGYNQPAHLGFDFTQPAPKPAIRTIQSR
ncbi:rhamnogalacturonan lyase [Roseibacillus ishigakijimensis]|uniref:Rhamnogalacturonan I lyase beta-sheet domain-containing protein n=2 Tax=Roseibacillus ishigakijimensis TaxID=454146 RepID=A0A934RTG6_9BACT|nr:hypothetical protein [Roseibacillus ishigakijimensis]